MTESTFSSSSFPKVPLPTLSTLRNIVTHAPEPLRPLARRLLNTLNPIQGIQDDDYCTYTPCKAGEYSDEEELSMSVESLLSENEGLEVEGEEGWVDIQLEDWENDMDFDGRKRPDGRKSVENEEDMKIREQKQEAEAVRRWKEAVRRERYSTIPQRIANPKTKILSMNSREQHCTTRVQSHPSQARTQEQTHSHTEPQTIASRALLLGHVLHNPVARPRKFSDCRVTRPSVASPQSTQQRQDIAEPSTSAPGNGV